MNLLKTLETCCSSLFFFLGITLALLKFVDQALGAQADILEELLKFFQAHIVLFKSSRATPLLAPKSSSFRSFLKSLLALCLVVVVMVTVVDQRLLTNN